MSTHTRPSSEQAPHAIVPVRPATSPKTAPASATLARLRWRTLGNRIPSRRTTRGTRTTRPHAVLVALVSMIAMTAAARSSSGGGGGSSGSHLSGSASGGATASASSGQVADGGTTSIQPATGVNSGTGDHLDEVLTIASDTSGATGGANSLWNAVFPQFAGMSWTPAKFQAYHDGQSACGLSAQMSLNNAFYCYNDDVIWYNVDWLRQLYYQYGDYAPVVILLHEIGHRVAHLSGKDGKKSIEKEEEADPRIRWMTTRSLRPRR